jgi:hypothetical protein
MFSVLIQVAVIYPLFKFSKHCCKVQYGSHLLKQAFNIFHCWFDTCTLFVGAYEYCLIIGPYVATGLVCNVICAGGVYCFKQSGDIFL